MPRRYTYLVGLFAPFGCFAMWGGSCWRFGTCWPHMQRWNSLLERSRTCELLFYLLIGLNCGDYYFDPSFTTRYTTGRLKSTFLFMEFAFWISAVNLFRTAWTIKYPFLVFLIVWCTLSWFVGSDSVKRHSLVRTEDPFILKAVL